MLYPLSYEGLRCTFAQHAATFGPLGLGRLPRSRRSVPQLCRVPWASFWPAPRRAAPIIWLGARGAGRELEIGERLGSTINSVPLAVVMLDRSGANLVAPSRLGAS